GPVEQGAAQPRGRRGPDAVGFGEVLDLDDRFRHRGGSSKGVCRPFVTPGPAPGLIGERGLPRMVRIGCLFPLMESSPSPSSLGRRWWRGIAGALALVSLLLLIHSYG